MNQMAEQLEDRLQTVIKEKNQREAVLSSMVEGVLAVDTDGHIISLNKAAAKFFKVVQPENAKGRSIEEVFRNVKLQKFIGSVLKGQETLECELTVQHNEIYDLQARGTNLLGVQGRRIGAVIVFNDVSRLRRLENIRREFVANVSHELKTPITSIKGFVETLLDGAINDPEEANRFLQIVAKHADRLNAIIDDLLTLSRLEQGDKEEMEMQRAGLAGLMNSSVEVCAHRAKLKNISIKIECPDDLSASVNPPLIEQALINLIGNAVKYSQEGKTVTVRAIEDPDGVTLSVSDQGYGIASEHLERLFERFYRVDKGRSRQEGGTGLGLAIVKHIAQAHGGAVSVDSRFGEGSTFSIFLPKA
jgi:two-component system phosphate regulon sensor histidine kinase PhoR